MKKILGAIGLGILTGIAIGGYMSWKKSKEVDEKIDEVFNDEFMDYLNKGISKSCDDINKDMVAKTNEAWEDLKSTKETVMNDIKARHEKLNEEIEKMKQNAEDLEKVVEASCKPKEEVATPVVEEIKITEAEKKQHEKNMQILNDCEKKIDDLLDDLNK